jgi:lysyl-tRNA synthetase class 1
VGHWADEIADRILREKGSRNEISTGISPSGEIHIGNLREVVTADAIYRVLRERGAHAGFHYIADNFDPLRRLYPFLEERVYKPLIGRPLSELPCPCGGHASYSDHFVEPFLATLRELHIDVTVFRSDEIYKSGRMTPLIVAALEGRDRIAVILQEHTGKRFDAGWSPFNPLCEGCGRINTARLRGFDAREETIDYECPCGRSGTRPMAGGGKLTWRIDWPARWKLFGVTVEPFGKDHGTRGGSYDTGVHIMREVFGGEPPFPVPYEWISLKGRGDMSSSKGNVLSIRQMLEVVPAEVLRYLIVRTRPQRSIPFDPGKPLLSLVDEYDDRQSSSADTRALALSRAGGSGSLGVPFRHLVTVVQIARGDVTEAERVLARNGYEALDRDTLVRRMDYATRWLERFAPPEMRFAVQDELPEAAASLDDRQRAFLAELAGRLKTGMDAESVHKAIYAAAATVPDRKPAQLFEAVYLALLGQARGPRAGWFLSFLGLDFCARRFCEAAGLPPANA